MGTFGAISHAYGVSCHELWTMPLVWAIPLQFRRVGFFLLFFFSSTFHVDDTISLDDTMSDVESHCTLHVPPCVRMNSRVSNVMHVQKPDFSLNATQVDVYLKKEGV